MSKDRPLDPVQLRSFIAVAETQHFTAAARRLGLGQSTVSQHVARLEEALGRSLLSRNARSVELTSDGSVLLDLARDIVAANDRALGYFDQATLRGRLRFGVSEDLVLSSLPDILGAFRAAHPLVDLDLQVGLSSQLYDALDSGRLDLLFAKRREGDPRGRLVWRERLCWLGPPGFRAGCAAPVPLVLYPGASITRRAAIEAMNQARLPWYVAFASHSLTAMTAALRAGFGVTAQSAMVASRGVILLDDTAGLPPLPEVDYVVLGRVAPVTGPARALADAIAEHAPSLAVPAARRALPSQPGRHIR